MSIKRGAIRAARKAAQLTQEEAARRAKMASKQSWYKIESGQQADVMLSTLERMAKVCGVKAKEWLE